MCNPWEEVSLEDYEKHMELPSVQQLQTLSKIMKSQLYQYKVSTVAILGIAGGNGLEHIDTSQIKVVYGIDINQNYLDICKERYRNLKDYLILENLDLSNVSNDLPVVDIIIANMFIEYIGVDMFLKQLVKDFPQYVSCVIQKNPDTVFVSDSPYVNVFNGISTLHRDIEQNFLIESMSTIGYSLIFSEEHILPNMKKFIRLDFINN